MPKASVWDKEEGQALLHSTGRETTLDEKWFDGIKHLLKGTRTWNGARQK